MTLCFIFSAMNLQAQIIEGPQGTAKYKAPPSETVDTARLIAIYGHWMHDAVLDNDRYEDDILAIGNHSSLYSSYGWYRVDSILNALYPEGCLNMIFFATAASVSNFKHSKYTFKNYKESVTTDKIDIGFNHYKYFEPLSEMDWDITDITTNFQGLSCVKAECHFRGRDWTAWFAPDIPVNDGPWKFHGLPGLIIYIADSDKAHVFSLLDLRNPDTGGEIHPIKILTNDSAIPTTREKALKRTYDVAMDPRLLKEEGLFGDIDTNDFGQRLFYAPLELE